MQNCWILLCSVAYVVTQILPNWTIVFGALPFVVLLFLHLKEKKLCTHLCLLSIFIPFFWTSQQRLFLFLAFDYCSQLFSSLLIKNQIKSYILDVYLCVYSHWVYINMYLLFRLEIIVDYLQLNWQAAVSWNCLNHNYWM